MPDATDFMKLVAEGYAGVTGSGQIVDRREHPKATPVQENAFLGIPKPQPVTVEEKYKESRLLRDIYIQENFHLEGLLEIGFIQTTDPTKCTYVKSLDDYEGIERRIVTWFGFKSIFDYDHVMDEKPEMLPVLNRVDWVREQDKLPIHRN